LGAAACAMNQFEVSDLDKILIEEGAEFSNEKIGRVTDSI